MHVGREPDGVAFLAARLAWMSDRCARGERAIAVFDLDNTVFDTRPRTLAVARAYDADRATAWFADLALDGVRRDGRTTAADPSLGPPPPPVIDDFATYWDEGFWRPAAFAHDAPIAPIVAWAQAALAVGADVRFLTGRIEALRDPSLDALRRIGLGGGTLACKPDLSTPTAPWKCHVLARWSLEAPIGWFVTEGRRDTARIRAELPDTPCALLDCSFEESLPVAPGTPLLPRVF